MFESYASGKTAELRLLGSSGFQASSASGPSTIGGPSGRTGQHLSQHAADRTDLIGEGRIER